MTHGIVRSRSRLAILLAAGSSASTAIAQLRWQDLSSPVPGYSNVKAIAQSPNRGRITMLIDRRSVSGVPPVQTWEWDGTTWHDMRPPVQPPPRDTTNTLALAFDVLRNRVVLFGGGQARDTWEWDGATWMQRTPATSPPARTDHAMAFDLARGRTVLFGGSLAGLSFANDTWEWDGTNWTAATTPVLPPERRNASLAYHVPSQRVVLFGGRQSSSQLLADTWQWDGMQWTRATPANVPPARAFAGLATDPGSGQLILHGGNGPNLTSFSDTWRWDGQDWTPLAPPVNPQLGLPSLAWEPATNRTVLVGIRELSLDLWDWDGSAWRLRAADPNPQIGFGRLTRDVGGGLLLMIAGGDFVAERWSGGVWHRLAPATLPPSRSYFGMTLDSVRQRVVMFGGTVTGPVLGDTFEWDGTTWTQIPAAPAPPARMFPAMTFDPLSGRTLLFGGSAGAQVFGDLWEFDGTSWRQNIGAAVPTPRAQAAMVADETRHAMVLFGGTSISGALGDTWLWDGTNWSLVQPRTLPLARWGHAMTFDAVRGRVQMFGGIAASQTLLDDVWEWDGADWIPSPSRGPRSCTLAAMAFAPEREQTILWGGSDLTSRFRNDTWTLDSVHPARYVAYGTGCAGTAGTPQLAADGWSRPWLGEVFHAVASGFGANRPALVLFGSSRTSFAGVPLPLDLTGAGMPGCFLNAAPTWMGGIALGPYAIPIPADAALVDASFFNQVLAADPGTNPAGLVASTGMQAVVGQR